MPVQLLRERWLRAGAGAVDNRRQPVEGPVGPSDPAPDQIAGFLQLPEYALDLVRTRRAPPHEVEQSHTPIIGLGEQIAHEAARFP